MNSILTNTNTNTNTNNSQYSIAMLICAVFISGCSSSAESDSDGVQIPMDGIVAGTVEENGTAGDDMAVEIIDIDAGTESEESNPTQSSETESSSDPDVVSVPEPLTQNVTRVDFSITVPAYQSNALQVRLTWDDKAISASWIGDELWSVSTDLPINTEHLLTITFYDNNGELELGTYEKMYRTGTNAADNYQVSADQFDSIRWDADGDSISNLDESQMGTDPLVFENIDLEVRETRTVDASIFIAEMFSRRLPAERPYSFSSELSELPEGCEPDCSYHRRNIHTIAIDIDDNGNGTINDFHEKGSSARPANIRLRANRVVAENTVNWEGSWQHFDEYRDGWTENIRSNNTIAEIDVDKRSYVGTSSRWSGADYRQASSVSEHNLIGSTIEGSTFCEPIAGSIVTNTNDESGYVNTTTISRSLGDLLWTVSVSNTEDDTLTNVYFVRSLTIQIWQDEKWTGSGYPSMSYESDGKFNCELE